MDLLTYLENEPILWGKLVLEDQPSLKSYSSKFYDQLPLSFRFYVSDFPKFFIKSEENVKFIIKFKNRNLSVHGSFFFDEKGYLISLIIKETEDNQWFLDRVNKLEDSEFWEKSEAHQKTKELFFKNSKVQVGKIEGQAVRESTLILGTSIGPEYGSLWGLAHEMAHLIEIDDKRALRPRWGFYYGPETQAFNGSFNTPTNFKASLREARTMAVQGKIHEMVGLDFELKKDMSALKLMHDFHLVPGKNEEERFEYLYQYSLEYFNTLSHNFILKEWERKNLLISK